MKYGELNLGQVEAIVNKLGGMEGVQRFLSGELVVNEVKKAVQSVLKLLTTLTVSAVPSKNTKDCFTNTKRYYYRDGDLDNWLPKKQEDEKADTFTVYKLTESATFKQMAESILGFSGDVKTLSKLLKKEGRTTTLPMIESLIERQDNGEDVGLRTDGYANFFFTEEKDGGVSVVRVLRGGDGQWDVSVYRLDSGSRWDAEGHVFSRNLSL